MRILDNEMDSLKRKVSTNYDLVAMTCKAADAKSNTTDIVIGLHQETVSSFDFDCRVVDGAVIEVSRRLKKAFVCEARSLQQIVRDPVRAAAKGTCGRFACAPVAIDKSLRVIFG